MILSSASPLTSATTSIIVFVKKGPKLLPEMAYYFPLLCSRFVTIFQWPIGISILARICAHIEKNKEKFSSSHQEALGFGGANVDLDAEIERMVE